MLIKSDFTEVSPLPPRPFLEAIMDTTMRAYCFLWDRKSRDNKIKMSWKELRKYYNKNNFLSSLRKLCTQGLLSYKESELGVCIELVSWEDLVGE